MAYPYTSKVLQKLGVRSWINARNWSTDTGGNLLDDRVLSAMREVSQTFVDMRELIGAAGEKIAKLCRAEEAHITTGASGAIELAVAGCMAGTDLKNWMSLPDSRDMKNEVLLARGHYINYTPQWKASGSRIVEYGISGMLKPSRQEMEALISDQTCCIAHTLSYNNVPRGVQPFGEVVEVGRKHGIPVVVDAASELPPVGNLYRFLESGADIVCYSGGKAIGGPNNTGFMIGKGRGAEIIKAIRQFSFPNHGWARGFKLSKEQVVGLVTALELFVREGDDLYDKQLLIAHQLFEALKDLPPLEVTIVPNDDSYHEHPMISKVPRVLLRWDAKETGLTADELDQFMAAEDPPVYLRNIHYYEYYTNKEWRLIDTFFLRPPDIEIILERLKAFFSQQ
jgi:D-glucosaminate-6-phosphate ammonia-lyase